MEIDFEVMGHHYNRADFRISPAVIGAQDGKARVSTGKGP